MSDTVTQSPPATDVSKYMYQIRKLKDALVSTAKDRDSFKAEADQYRKDAADLKLKWDESTIAKRLEAAEGKLREVEYRKTWDRVAKAKGIRDDALDAAYQLGGYKPDGDQIDEDALGNAIDAQKSKQGFLVAPKVDKAEAATEKPPAKPAAGTGQGGKSSGTPGFVLPDENDGRWNDNMWQWNHRKEIAQAVREKRERGEV